MPGRSRSNHREPGGSAFQAKFVTSFSLGSSSSAPESFPMATANPFQLHIQFAEQWQKSMDQREGFLTPLWKSGEQASVLGARSQNQAAVPTLAWPLSELAAMSMADIISVVAV